MEGDLSEDVEKDLQDPVVAREEEAQDGREYRSLLGGISRRNDLQGAIRRTRKKGRMGKYQGQDGDQERREPPHEED